MVTGSLLVLDEIIKRLKANPEITHLHIQDGSVTIVIDTTGAIDNE